MRPLAHILALALLAAVRGPPPLLPSPLRYGADQCARCSRPLTHRGYGGEMLDEESQVTRYDDVGCLLLAMRESPALVIEAWVADHESDVLVPVLDATLVHGPRIWTPHGSGIVAFADPGAAREFARETGAEVLDADSLLGGAAWRR